jgi:hypothetical protein
MKEQVKYPKYEPTLTASPPVAITPATARTFAACAKVRRSTTWTTNTPTSPIVTVRIIAIMVIRITIIPISSVIVGVIRITVAIKISRTASQDHQKNDSQPNHLKFFVQKHHLRLSQK